MNNESKFWKIVFGSGGVTACNMLRAFVVNKLLAIFLPPSFFACVGQLQNFMTAGQAMSSLAMQNGWVSLTAQNLDDRKKLAGIWRSVSLLHSKRLFREFTRGWCRRRFSFRCQEF